MENLINPQHYQNEDGTQTINIIKNKLLICHGRDGYEAYLVGSWIKYSERAGKKQYEGYSQEESYQIDIKKASWFLKELDDFINCANNCGSECKKSCSK